MQLRNLGVTGVKVSPLCLGAMMFGNWGNTDHDESIRIIHRALDAGINFIDTADVYSRGESEEIVGKALAGRRDQVVLATKSHGVMGDDPNMAGNSRRWLVREVDNSLRRLGTDYIDLYQMHRPDPATDIEETLSALTDLIRAGKVRAIGSSTFPAEQIVEAQWAAERRGYERFRCEQPPYSILARAAESAVLPACARYGMGVITWSPLAGGWLTGKYREDEPPPPGSRMTQRPEGYRHLDTPATYRGLELLARAAAERGVDTTTLALAWVLSHPHVTGIVVGPRRPEHLEPALRALDLHLTPDERDDLAHLFDP
jgi:aryl-alcohol dehydrogenase (NADP+)